MSSDEKPVCWGRRHRFVVERYQGGSVSVAEFLDDDAVAFARCVSPTPQEWMDWLHHAWQAGQDFEVRQRDEFDAAEETPPCPTCTGDCVCSDTVKEARARFAADGEGAVRRKPPTTTYYGGSYPRTAPAATPPAEQGGDTTGTGSPGVTAPFPAMAGPDSDTAGAGADADSPPQDSA